MCVQTQHNDWERPAEVSDLPLIEKHFPDYALEEAFDRMSENGFQPLTSDLVLLAAMLATPADAGGMRYVPFSGLDTTTSDMVKLPVMDQIEQWFENTALGSDMWKQASDWTEEVCDGRVHFAMNCGCGIVDVRAYGNGKWSQWLKDFNASRAQVVGRTSVVRYETNDVSRCDITSQQLLIWNRIRSCLESLPASLLDCDQVVA